jgi:hypothetical protein
MLYRPNFCCHCGEKIVRARWTPLTSRRFCEFCAIEQKQHDLLPRAVVVLMFLGGAAGLVAYLGTPSPSRTAKTSVNELRDGLANKQLRDPQSNASRADRQNPSAANMSAPLSNTAAANSKQRDVPQISSTEPVYHCGAITKKGTPCTRRVKAKGRCWQHAGQPAIQD